MTELTAIILILVVVWWCVIAPIRDARRPPEYTPDPDLELMQTTKYYNSVTGKMDCEVWGKWNGWFRGKYYPEEQQLNPGKRQFELRLAWERNKTNQKARDK